MILPVTDQPEPEPTMIDSWAAAEHNAAAWMRHWGYTDARVTSPGPDGGIDVKARTALGQVKFEASQVGAPTVQQLVGARGLDNEKDLFFFSGAGFAATAVTYANTMSVALFKYDLLGRMTPVNPAASAITERARVPQGPATIAEARARLVEAEARLATALADIDPDPRQFLDVLYEMRADDKLTAIRIYRNLTGTVFDEAEPIIEAAMATLVIAGPQTLDDMVGSMPAAAAALEAGEHLVRPDPLKFLRVVELASRPHRHLGAAAKYYSAVTGIDIEESKSIVLATFAETEVPYE